ncbi:MULTISPECIES: hypothetical protein [unclassified Pseudomonas]|uniref:hypothetical protein n=1 Tax=unclassified Pseudomonas TaxID=196821 RepID=UPI0011B42EFD|nr:MULTISPECIES: hypothetical protein [unclassified Pseudomonas]
MLELIIAVVGVVVAIAAYRAGLKQGAENAFEEQAAAISKGLEGGSVFQRVLGAKGMFFGTINPKLGVQPLVIVFSKDFFDLVSHRKLSPAIAESLVSQEREVLQSEYNRDSGISPEMQNAAELIQKTLKAD